MPPLPRDDTREANAIPTPNPDSPHIKKTRVLILGGGFGGVETMGSINDFIHEALPYYPNLKREMIRMVLVHPGEHVLPELGPKLGRYADGVLKERGIEIHAKSKVASVTPRTVTLNDSTVIESFTLIWTAGTAPSPILDKIALPRERGKLKVAPTLAVEGALGIWALGDCALIPDVRQPGSFHPPTAQHASRQGVVLARNVIASIQHRPLENFSFKTLGLLAAIGRRTGVARMLGFNFSEFIVWWMWRTIYLSKLPRLEKKITVALAWTLDLFFTKDFVQYLDVNGTPQGSVRPPTEYIPLREVCEVPPTAPAATPAPRPRGAASISFSFTAPQPPDYYRR